MRLRLLATLAAFVWIPAAQAATMVWFETSNTNGNGPGVAGGAAGNSLFLTCDSSGPIGFCSWQIAMRAALGPGGITGWSLDLRTAPGNNVSLINPQVQPGSPFNNSASPGMGGVGAALLQGAHAQTFIPVSPQTLTLMTFTLRQNVVTGDLSFKTIYGGPAVDGLIVWANDMTGDYEVVQFGPNPPAMALEGTVGALPLIMIGTPEPASLSLLTLGSVVVLMRRRAQSP